MTGRSDGGSSPQLLNPSPPCVVVGGTGSAALELYLALAAAAAFALLPRVDAAASAAAAVPKFFGVSDKTIPTVTAPPLAAFAGFGSRKAASGKKKAASREKKKGGGGQRGRGGKRAPRGGAAVATTAVNTAAGSPNTAAPVQAQASSLLTPEGRIAHIQSRIENAELAPISQLTLTSDPTTGQFSLDVNPNAICVVDDFLGPDLILAMRSEAEGLLPTMVPSQSTRWDEATQSVVPYDKVGVLSTQIEGGEVGYKASPRLVEYVATLTGTLTSKLNEMVPDAYKLKVMEQTNKLAVCLGDGSRYDKHIDNLGGGGRGGGGEGDQRKLTALLYLQPPNSHPSSPSYPDETEESDDRGGYFRAYDVPKAGDVTSIAPRGDRLLLFWSDALVHDVSPSFAPNGEEERRWALTVWMLKDDKMGIIRGMSGEVEGRHFGSG